MTVALANRQRAHWTNVAAMLGVDLQHAWPRLLLGVLLQPQVEGLDSAWWGRLAKYFPQIDFHHFHIGDLIRFPLQFIWICLVRPTPLLPSGVAEGPWSRAKRLLKTYSHAFSSRLMPLFTSISAALSARRVHRTVDHDVDRMQASVERNEEASMWDHPFARYGSFIIAGVLGVMCITTPFNTLAQIVFVTLLWTIAMLIRRLPGPGPTLFLIVLSLTTSTRYLWWRIAYTLNWDESLDLMWGLILLCAEIYTWIVLVLGYVQTAWPLKREPIALPNDQQEWPTVDVFIPTYNEPLKVVTPTVYAALSIDWPRDKLNIYLLDDGRRDEFQQFAEEVGIHYLRRPDNKHAKAGNLNHALGYTHGEFIAIFDCDHIPTRSFLQTTMGWFLREPKLALLQTPHHFFSPDPFERNLGLFRHVPNEGELFYGVIQDCNDLWNATFFCGSCAVIKRAPLLQVGGIAVETVTEDAHTALKLQRLGYSSAYINLPQAAGLATESLSAHIGQRIRWARGMAQIFRLDNPFLGKGLNWAQRICYGNAMLHFLNGGPRLIFLTAPLAFLLFHAYVIYTPAISVILYVLPHMVHANITNSRIQGGHRHSFWAEVYETVLAWYIVRPTTVALLNPHKGKFNVTAKGGLVDKSYFDWHISLPYMVIVGLNVIGFAVGVGRILWGPGDEIATTLLNMFWTIYNLLILGAAISVASETKQIRHTQRVTLKIPAILHLSCGELVHCHTDDFSEGGVALAMDEAPTLKTDEAVSVSLWRGAEEYVFPARVVGTAATRVRVRWELTTAEQNRSLVQCTFVRADAWVSWSEGRLRDRPLSGLRRVLATGVQGYRRLAKQSWPTGQLFYGKVVGSAHYLASLLPRQPGLEARSSYNS